MKINHSFIRVLCALCVLCGLPFAVAVPAGAEVELQGASWQRVEQAELAPGAPLKGRLLAKVKLLNRGPATEGILLRYTVSAKIAPIAQPQQPASWALPFMLEEKRVPKVGANRFLEATLDPTALTNLYLRKLRRMGYRPLELRLQVMLEPRPGSAGPLQILESALSIKN